MCEIDRSYILIFGSIWTKHIYWTQYDTQNKFTRDWHEFHSRSRPLWARIRDLAAIGRRKCCTRGNPTGKSGSRNRRKCPSRNRRSESLSADRAMPSRSLVGTWLRRATEPAPLAPAPPSPSLWQKFLGTCFRRRESDAIGHLFCSYVCNENTSTHICTMQSAGPYSSRGINTHTEHEYT